MEKIINIPLSQLEPNKFNPNVMAEEEFESLKEGMKVTGPNHDLAVDPLLVSPKTIFYSDPKAEPKVYVIVDGENRWKSAKELKWNSIPCEVRNIGEDIAKVLCYRRNRERGSLDPLKEALLFKSELDIKLTQEMVARKYNVSRPHVAHRLSLLHLDKKVTEMYHKPEKTFGEIKRSEFQKEHKSWEKLQTETGGKGWMQEPELSEEDLVPHGTISASHLEAIVTLPRQEQVNLAAKILGKDLTVRQTERQVKQRKEEIAREKRFKEALKKAKRPKCPECGGEPEGFNFTDETRFKCGNRGCYNSWYYMKTKKEVEAEKAKQKTESHKDMTDRFKEAREHPTYIRMPETPQELHEKVKEWVLTKVLELTEIERVTVYGKRGATVVDLSYTPPTKDFHLMDLSLTIGQTMFGFKVQAKEYKKYPAKSRVDLLWGVKPTEKNREALRRFFAETVKTNKDPEGATRKR